MKIGIHPTDKGTDGLAVKAPGAYDTRRTTYSTPDHNVYDDRHRQTAMAAGNRGNACGKMHSGHTSPRFFAIIGIRPPDDIYGKFWTILGQLKVTPTPQGDIARTRARIKTIRNQTGHPARFLHRRKATSHARVRGLKQIDMNA